MDSNCTRELTGTITNCCLRWADETYASRRSVEGGWLVVGGRVGVKKTDDKRVFP